MTSFLKAYFKRKRPENPPETASNCRRIDLRSKETNCSFPSGDAAQSALLCMHIMINYKATFYLAGGVVGVGQLMISVSFARVYFHCHWIGDVLAGSVIGLFFGFFVSKLPIELFLKIVFEKYLKRNLVDDDLYNI